MTRLVMAGAAAALASGLGRMTTGAVAPEAGTPLAELVYAAIDLGFVLAIIAVFLASESRTGWRGWAPFLVALAGAASIVGPDGKVAGMDGWLLGSAVLLIGLAGVGAVLLWRDRRFAAPSLLWIASLVCALAGQPQWAGIAVGAGFASAGVAMLLQPAFNAPVSASHGRLAGPS